MSKIFGLIKNEWIKQYKKVSVKVILILILVASVAAPFLLKHFNSSDNMKWDIENYNSNIEWLNMDIQGLDSSAKNADINKQILQIEVDGYQLRIDNNIQWSDWRDSLVYEMQDSEKMALMLSGIRDGLTSTELTNNIYQMDVNQLEGFYDMPKEDLQKEIDKFTNEATATKKTIMENDYLGYLAGVIKNTETEITEAKKQLTVTEADIAKDKENKDLKEILEFQKQDIAMQEELLGTYKYKYDNKIIYDRNDWKHNTVEDIKESISVKNETLLTEDQFKQQFNWEINRQGYTYEKYQEQREKRIETAQEDLALDWYSLENDIPRVQFIRDARNSLNETYLFYVTIAILLCIIIGGGIVSSEYSTGTVRLLMIRPVSRWKILLSKFIAVFLIGYGAMFIAFIINIISSGVVHGFGTLGTPLLAVKDGVIVHQSFILSLIPNLMFASISLIFIIAVVFFLSTVGRNTALAVGLTMVGYLGSMPATQVAAQLGFKWVDKTFLPYVNLSTYVGGESWMIEMLEQAGMKLNPTLGAFYLLAIAAVLTVISFVVFKRRDVTN